MDDSSDSSLWHRLTKIFHGNQLDAVEQAIRDASEEGQLDKEEGSMLLSILSLDEMQVQDIMTPRTDIVCAPEDASIRVVSELSIESGHSRIPIFSGNRDNITGLVHAKDLLQHLLDPAEHGNPVTTIMRTPFFVPETKNVYDVLQEFRARKQHLAVILDEYGGTAGLVSIEDVLEVIVGDIEDEHDTPRQQEIARQPDGSYLISGRTYLEDLDESLRITLESEEVDTLGGYLTHLAGRVPLEGERFVIDEHLFIVETADAKQIHCVRLTTHSLQEEAAPEGSTNMPSTGSSTNVSHPSGASVTASSSASTDASAAATALTAPSADASGNPPVSTGDRPLSTPTQAVAAAATASTASRQEDAAAQ